MADRKVSRRSHGGMAVPQEGLAENERRLREMFMQTTLPQALTDADGRFVMANTAYCDLVGYSDIDLFTTTFNSITHPQDLPAQHAAIARLMAGREPVVHLTKRYLRGDGSVLQCELGMGVVRDDAGVVRYLHGAIEHVSTAGETGGLSPVDSPVVFQTAVVAREQLAQLLASSQTGHVQVVLMRLAGLEQLAGVIGWSSVDFAHAQVVDRIAAMGSMGIRAVVPIGVTDLLVLADSADGGGLPAILHAALRAPLAVSGVHLPVSLRIGVTSGGLVDDPDVLLRQARVALNQALSSGSPEVRYHPDLDRSALDDFALTTEIAYAIAHDQFVLHYQPKYRLTPFALVGFEALLRWRHPERGDVPPERVVRLAETSGLVAPLTCWVIDAAAAQARVWQDAGYPQPIAINISPEMLANPILPLRLSQAMTRHRLSTSSIELEITETALSTEPHAITAVQQLAGLGYSISVDDFGTGYSSLGAIKNLPLRGIKIDQAFIRNLANDDRDQAVVAAVIEIAHRLGSRVIAEGVEDERTLSLLRSLGCDEAQGYHLGHPAPAHRVGRHFRNQ